MGLGRGQSHPRVIELRHLSRDHNVSASRTASRFCCCQPFSDHDFPNNTSVYWGFSFYVIGSGGWRSISLCTASRFCFDQPFSDLFGPVRTVV